MLVSKKRVIVLALVALILPAVAHASPGGLSVTVPQEPMSDVPTNGVLMFDGYTAGTVGPGNAPNYLEFEVTDSEGNAVAGSVDVIETEDEGICCAEVMVIWQPDELLAANTTYDGIVRRASVDAYADPPGPDWQDATEHSFTFQTGEFRDVSHLGAAEMAIEDAQVSVEERRIETDCCQSDQECSEGQTSCRHCWGSRVERYPVVAGTVAMGENAWLPSWLFRVVPTAGEPTSYRELSTLPGFGLEFASDNHGPYCMRIEAINTSHGIFVVGEEVCFDLPADASLGETSAERPDHCLDEQQSSDAGPTGDAGADAGGDEEADVGADDAGNESDAANADTGAGAGADSASQANKTSDKASGCSHAPGTASPSRLAVVLAFVLLACRRRCSAHRGL